MPSRGDVSLTAEGYLPSGTLRSLLSPAGIAVFKAQIVRIRRVLRVPGRAVGKADIANGAATYMSLSAYNECSKKLKRKQKFRLVQMSPYLRFLFR